MRRRCLCCLTVALIACRSAPSSSGEPPGGGWTLAAAVDSALAHHPSVALAAAVQAQARTAVVEAKSGWWPSLSATASLTQYEEPMAVTPIHGFDMARIPPFDQTLTQVGLVADYNLFDGGARFARTRQARREVDAADAGWMSAQQTLTAGVIAAYLDVLGKRELVAAHDRRVAALAAERERAGRLHGVGRAADVDVLRVEAALTAAEADRVHAVAACRTAEGDLTRLVGIDAASDTDMQLLKVALVDTAGISRDSASAAARLGPVLTQARHRLAAADAGRQAARRTRWPSLRLTANYIDRGDDQRFHAAEWSAGATLSLPLFTGRAISAAIARADASAHAADEQVRLAELDVAGEVDRAFAGIAEADARASGLAVSAARYGEVVRIEKLRLETGAGTQTDYLAVEADLLTAQTNLIAARRAQILARVELARVTGELTPAWVREHLESEK